MLMRFNVAAINKFQLTIRVNDQCLENPTPFVLNDHALNLLQMEFQLPNAFGKSRHGQPTHIRYSIPSTVISKLRLL